MKYSLVFIIFIHGAIHLMGFAKAFKYGEFPQLTKDISRPAGLAWLATAVLLILVAVLFLTGKSWWLAGLSAAILSQALILSNWEDAKFGTLANLIILVAAVLAMGSERFENRFRQDVRTSLERNKQEEDALLTEADLQHLPAVVQQYLRYTGVLNKPKLRNMRVTFSGQMRERGKDWFVFHSEQYNFFDRPERLFFMKGKMYGVTVPGYHAYLNHTASMQIKLFGLLPIVNLSGEDLRKTETVTVFNDMCLMAPASLIDKRISWESLDSLSVKAVFTVDDVSISARLYFNEKGELTNFISDDRMAVAEMKRFPFSTPVFGYSERRGYKLATGGEAVWHYPEEAFTYGKFYVEDIEYNVE